MEVKDFLNVLKEHNIPEDVKILSDSGSRRNYVS